MEKEKLKHLFVCLLIAAASLIGFAVINKLCIVQAIYDVANGCGDHISQERVNSLESSAKGVEVFFALLGWLFLGPIGIILDIILFYITTVIAVCVGLSSSLAYYIITKGQSVKQVKRYKFFMYSNYIWLGIMDLSIFFESSLILETGNWLLRLILIISICGYLTYVIIDGLKTLPKVKAVQEKVTKQKIEW